MQVNWITTLGLPPNPCVALARVQPGMQAGRPAAPCHLRTFVVFGPEKVRRRFSSPAPLALDY